jgi:hypothetical protein
LARGLRTPVYLAASTGTLLQGEQEITPGVEYR